MRAAQRSLLRRAPSQDNGALTGLALSGFALVVALLIVSGCAAFKSAAPIVAPIFLAGVEASIRIAIDQESDPGKRALLEESLRIIEAIRAAQAAADAAERRAAEVQALGHDDAARTEWQSAAAERQRAQLRTLELRGKIARVGMAKPPAAAPDAGAP